MKRRLDIIGNQDGIEAVLGEPTHGTPPEGKGWCGSFAALNALHVGARLLDQERALFDAELTARWGRLVACTQEFSVWWRARPTAAAPASDFFLEVDS